MLKNFVSEVEGGPCRKKLAVSAAEGGDMSKMPGREPAGGGAMSKFLKISKKNPPPPHILNDRSLIATA